MPENILFDSEFNPSDFVKGIDAIIDKGKELQVREKELQGTLEETTLALQQKNEQIRRQQILLESAKGANEDLRDSERQLQKELTSLMAQFNAQNLKLEQLRKSNIELEQAMNKAGVAATNLQKTVGKPLAVTLNSNQAITGIQKLTASIETLRAKILVKQELLIKETDLNKIRQYNKEIDLLSTEMKRIANAGKTGFDEFGNAVKKAEETVVKAEKSTNLLGKSFGFLRQAAYLIPGIGLAGIFNLIGEAAYNLAIEIFNDKDAFDELVKSQKLFEDAGKNAGGDLAKLELLKNKLNDVTLSHAQRLEVVQAYNKTADVGNQIDEKQLFNLYLINEQINKQIVLIEKRALAKAAENKLSESGEKLISAQFALDNIPEYKKAQKQIANIKAENDKILAEVGKRQLKNGKGSTQLLDLGLMTPEQAESYQRNLKNIEAINNSINYGGNQRIAAAQQTLGMAKETFDQQLKFYSQYLDPDSVSVKPGKPKKGPKEKKLPENVYEQMLTTLRQKLDGYKENLVTTYATISAKIQAETDKLNNNINKALKNKTLTEGQANNLRAIVGLISDAATTKEYRDYEKKVIELREKISDDLRKLKYEEAQKSLANISDDFKRETKAIELNSDKQIEEIADSRKDKMKFLSDEFARGFFGDPNSLVAKAALEEAKVNYNSLYDKLIEDVKAEAARKQQDLSAVTFQKALKVTTDTFNERGNTLGEKNDNSITTLTQAYLQGQMSYREYEKGLVKINEEYSREILFNNLKKEEATYTELLLRLGNSKASDKELEALNKQIQEAEKKLAELRRQIAQLTQTQTDKKTDFFDNKRTPAQQEEVDMIHFYIDLYNQLANAIGNAWSTANEAEAKHLDRSIALQQRRVDQAQKIADRGNATYLKAESDKMNDLQVKQEANARRQIAINAAIQGSQLLVAITGALTNIIVPGAGPALVISSIATIVGSLAAGYALVKSLQQNQPSFFVGTEDTGNGGNVDNKGGFPAILHPNERVVPAHLNKELKGISNEQLAETVRQHNLMVEQQYQTPALPELNYDRLENAAHFHITHDGKLAALMEENNMKQDAAISEMRGMRKALKDFSFIFNWDRNGVRAELVKGIEENNINKKI